MTDVPEETPKTTPVAAPIVAVPVALLDHVPPGVGLPRVEVSPLHTDSTPVIGVTALTVTTAVVKQVAEVP